MRQWVTLGLTMIGAAAPNLVTVLPPRYGAVASAAAALIGSVYHLYQDRPANG